MNIDRSETNTQLGLAIDSGGSEGITKEIGGINKARTRQAEQLTLRSECPEGIDSAARGEEAIGFDPRSIDMLWETFDAAEGVDRADQVSVGVVGRLALVGTRAEQTGVAPSGTVKRIPDVLLDTVGCGACEGAH